MSNSGRLVLAHFWLAFAVFGVAIVLGAWQMFIRSPLHAWISDPEWYYRSLTVHGTAMAYVLPTLVAMGFGYFVAEKSLSRPLVGLSWAQTFSERRTTLTRRSTAESLTTGKTTPSRRRRASSTHG